MKRTLQVFLGDEGRWVGTLHYDQTGAREHAAFAYADVWLAAADRFALAPGLPLVSGPQFHQRVTGGSVFPGLIADTEPDGWARRVILRDHAKRRQEARRESLASLPAQLHAVDALRIHGAAAQADIEELWRRLAFSILITNVDDHLHNHGFLHAESGLWRLAPAFDLNPFPDRARELKTWVSADTGPEATIDALLSVTAYFRLSLTKARGILAEVENAVATWRTVGRDLGMSARDLEDFAEAFEHPERQAARRASGKSK